MSLLESLPESYQFTPQDVDAHMELFAKEFVRNEELTEEEEDFYWTLHQAERYQCEYRKLPTVGQLREYIHEEAKREEQKRINSWRDAYVMTEKDFSEAAEPGGPLAQFIGVAKELKNKTGKFPTVAGVRARLRG